ncbi:adenosylcobalamin-dependent ribonucleoside-triphosphate reductase [Actinoplanes campanulatus]|nr:adenosylcobalamin-dependent ribonucleoside-triphosphate reductase [Actinoplanes campanulatus]GID42358.1 adenosylcobalamin-dependent ribonucleoside-triphosphate reductase [Actinoplanes campanulatus]
MTTPSFVALDETATFTEPEWKFGPSGAVVFSRTYARDLPNGEKETWPQVVQRVAEGNLALVHGPRPTWSAKVEKEFERLHHFMLRMAIIPGGRHLYATGVKGREFLFNCHVAPWPAKISGHFDFVLNRLAEGGGVGANYSTRFLAQYGAPRRQLQVHVVCDPSHPDYQEMLDAGLLSTEYSSGWMGSFDVDDSRQGWADAVTDLVDTFFTDDAVLHQNRVFDVSRVRWKGARLKTFGGVASGPAPLAQMLISITRILNASYFSAARDLSFCIQPLDAMEIDHALAECVIAGGKRRSARMSGLHWKDPQARRFVTIKQDSSLHWTSNLSVIIDDEFEQALRAGDPYATELHNLVVANMAANGEPGYWHADLNNFGEINEVVISNPCGEIGLPERGACVLGSVNLDYFAPKRRGGPVDWLGLEEAHRLMARFLVRATFGTMNDAGQAAVMNSERRIGVGHMGAQAFFTKRGYRYSQVWRLPAKRKELRGLYDVVRQAARDVSFELRIPEPVKVTTEAPTGSTSMLVGTTPSVQELFAVHYWRRIRFNKNVPSEAAEVEAARMKGLPVEVCVADKSGNTMVVAYPTRAALLDEVIALGYSEAEALELVESQDQISIDDKLATQAMFQQEYVDNAISYTCNIDPGTDPAELDAALRKHMSRIKGTTVMPDDATARPQPPLERMSREEYERWSALAEAGEGYNEECATGACPVR